jgi:hypothetical protein
VGSNGQLAFSDAHGISAIAARAVILGYHTRPMMTGWWSIGIAWLVACGPAIPPLPSRGGPAWLEVETEHFTLWTDAPARRAHDVMHELELRRELLVTAMNHPTAKTRAFVIALDNSRETEQYLPFGAIASAWDANNPTRQPGILLAADNDDSEHVVSHELTHVISFGIIRNQPHWLAEGIATYFEMVDLNSDGRSVQIGLPRDDRSSTLHTSPPLSIARLFGCTEARCMDQRTPGQTPGQRRLPICRWTGSMTSCPSGCSPASSGCRASRWPCARSRPATVRSAMPT